MQELNPSNTCADLPVTSMISSQPFKSMYGSSYELQQRLGTCGAICEPGTALPERINKLVYWGHCISDEFLELLEWLPGLNAERLKELHMEFIDMLCFVNNAGMTLGISIDEMDRHTAGISWYTYDANRGIDIYSLVKHEIAGRSKYHQIIKCLPWKTWKNYQDYDEARVLDRAKNFYFQYYRFVVSIAGILGLNKDTLFSLFQAKMVENHARQDRKY